MRMRYRKENFPNSKEPLEDSRRTRLSNLRLLRVLTIDVFFNQFYETYCLKNQCFGGTQFNAHVKASPYLVVQNWLH
jgi:hypothetical protein